MYRSEALIGFTKSFRLKTGSFYVIAANRYYPTLPESLKVDIHRCIDKRIYNYHSVGKGVEHHLTLILESRVLKLQKLARSFYQVKKRATQVIQNKARGKPCHAKNTSIDTHNRSYREQNSLLSRHHSMISFSKHNVSFGLNNASFDH